MTKLPWDNKIIDQLKKKNVTYAEIGKIFNLSRQRIHQLHKRPQRVMINNFAKRIESGCVYNAKDYTLGLDAAKLLLKKYPLNKVFSMLGFS